MQKVMDGEFKDVSEDKVEFELNWALLTSSGCHSRRKRESSSL